MPYGGSPARRGPKGAASIIQKAFRDYRARVSGGGRRRSAGARSMRLGGSMANALARVHTFKRVADPLVFTNNTSPARVTVKGSQDLVGGSGAPTVAAGAFMLSTSTVGAGLRFALSQLPGVTDITNLFDNYRLARVKLMFNLSYNSSEPTGSTLPIPVINYAYDPDDNQAPTARNTVLENGYSVTRRLDKPFSITLKPRAQQSVTGGNASAGGLLPANTWLDCGSPSIYHYGLKLWIDDFPYSVANNDLYAITITPVYYIEAKNVI